MKKLPNRELSDLEYRYLKSAFDFSGKEAKIIRDGWQAIKFFNDDFGQDDVTIDQIEMIRENKLNKLILLNNKKEYDEYLKPIKTYSYRGKFVAYKEIFIDSELFFDSVMSDDELLFYLRLIRETLAKYHSMGIVYGDIKDNNIFIDRKRKKILFCDIDNMKVEDYGIDLVGYFLQKFIDKYGKIDEKLDSYMFNLLAFDKIMKCQYWYWDVLERIEKEDVPMGIKNSDTKKLIRSMRKIDKNYQEEYVIDYLK